jgi:uncharacterized protein DUF6119
MADTARARVYRIRDGVDLAGLQAILTDDLKYQPIAINQLVQAAQEVTLSAYYRSTSPVPDWYEMIGKYILPPDPIPNCAKLDFVAIVETTSSDLNDYAFAIVGGAGFSHIADQVDYTFGITILSSLFDPSQNKLDEVSDKGIVGDVLASRRFYRRSRSLAYEDDFGKFFQKIGTKLRKTQIEAAFPRLVKAKVKRLKENVGFSGSAAVELKSRCNLPTILAMVRDLADVADRAPVTMFNTTLLPLEKKHNSAIVEDLDRELLMLLVNHSTAPANNPIDLVFCHRDFESFFESASHEVTFPGLTDATGEKLQPIVTDDARELSEPRSMRRIYERIRESHQYKVADDKVSQAMSSIEHVRVSSMTDDGHVATSGKLPDHIQMELTLDSVSYFHLDSRWYRLEAEFDSVLETKFRDRVSTHFDTSWQVPEWSGPDEAAYNELFAGLPCGYCLHDVKVNLVEICDGLVLDHNMKVAYLLHVKNGVNASIRDLTSQVFMSARIVEEEARSTKKPSLHEVYRQGVRRKRISPGELKESEFVRCVSAYRHRHVLVLHDSQKTRADIESGRFTSRIAKFSLIEFASVMSANEWPFQIMIAEDARAAQGGADKSAGPPA